MQLQELVDVSNAVAGARGRLDKIGKLAELLKRAAPEEVRLAVAFLSGALLQGRIGIGWSSVSQSRAVAPAMASSLSLRDTHDTFDRIASTKGAGATRARSQALSDLFRRATSTEQDFLVRLLSGELRQGAQEGVTGRSRGQGSRRIAGGCSPGRDALWRSWRSGVRGPSRRSAGAIEIHNPAIPSG